MTQGRLNGERTSPKHGVWEDFQECSWVLKLNALNLSSCYVLFYTSPVIPFESDWVSHSVSLNKFIQTHDQKLLFFSNKMNWRILFSCVNTPANKFFTSCVINEAHWWHLWNIIVGLPSLLDPNLTPECRVCSTVIYNHIFVEWYVKCNRHCAKCRLWVLTFKLQHIRCEHGLEE